VGLLLWRSGCVFPYLISAGKPLSAIVGGLHLTGGLFEAIIPRTVAELASIGPAIIVPGHCTGWKATHELARVLPGAYVQTNVGTRLHFA
jgi:7,8-dihydropterin-6-yl-methyl-4-(beta-D-ribofuranosyl)aminobenzene 5'-phosphate synthase